MIVIDYTDFPLPTQRPLFTQRPNSLTVCSLYLTGLMETILTNPEDSSIISRGLVALCQQPPENVSDVGF